MVVSGGGMEYEVERGGGVGFKSPASTAVGVAMTLAANVNAPMKNVRYMSSCGWLCLEF